MFGLPIGSAEDGFQTFGRRGGRAIVDPFGVREFVRDGLQLSLRCIAPPIQHPFKTLNVAEQECFELVLLDIRNNPMRLDARTSLLAGNEDRFFQFLSTAPLPTTETVEIHQSGEKIVIGVFVGEVDRKAFDGDITTPRFAGSSLEQGWVGQDAVLLILQPTGSLSHSSEGR